MNYIWLLGADAPQESGSFLLPIVMIGFIVILIVMNHFSNKKRRKQQEAMMASIKVGAEIVTIGGIIGKIAAINEDQGIYTINAGTDEEPTYLDILKGAIGTVSNPTNDAVEDKKEEAKAE